MLIVIVSLVYLVFLALSIGYARKQNLPAGPLTLGVVAIAVLTLVWGVLRNF